MNEQQIQRVAQATNALRPDWPVRSLATFINARGRLRDGAYVDVAAALAYIAADPETTTPARVLEAGPWWRIGSPDIGGQLGNGQCARCSTHHLATEPCYDSRRTPPSANTAAHLAEARRIAQAARRPAATEETK